MNKTSQAVEKLSVPLYWDGATDAQIKYKKVACVKKEELKAITKKYKKMEDALIKATMNETDVPITFTPEMMKYMREARDYDPLA